MSETAAIPPPPRLTGEPAADVQILQEYLWRFYRALNLEADVNGTLLTVGDRLAALEARADLQYTETDEQSTVTKPSSTTVAHNVPAGSTILWGLGFLRCKTAEGGYAVGDELHFAGWLHVSAGDKRNGLVSWDATNVTISIADSFNEIPHRTTGASFAWSTANWRSFARVFYVVADETEE